MRSPVTQCRVLVVALLACLLPAATASAARVEKVLPFTGLDNVRLHIVLSPDGSPGVVELAGKITPAGDANAKPLWQGPLGKVRVRANAPAELEKTIRGLQPKLWTPASPDLYTLTIDARQDGKPLETKPVRFGFRTMEARDGSLHLNGKPIFLRGIAINPPGRGVPPEVGHSRKFAEDYVRFMRAHNVNIIRLEPESDVWFDVCDELGMMIYQGVYGAPPGHADEDDRGKNKVPPVEGALAEYRKLFDNYVAHPSIVIYVLSNELPYEGTRGAAWHEFLTKVHDELKDEYPVPFIGNAGYGQGREGDINDVHRYWGWYYNSHLTYYNLRDPLLFGDPAKTKTQPFTFSECVGAFTGPSGKFNHVFRKQLGAALNWTGHAEDQLERSQDYQAFIFKHAAESFRTMRATNPRLSGLMPFTILFRNWVGISSFDQMGHNANAEQMTRSYSPVLLSWESWTPNVYAGTTLKAFAHVVNDAEDFSDLTGATLAYALRGPDGKPVDGHGGTVKVAPVKYYGTWKTPVELKFGGSLPTGRYTVHGVLSKGDRRITDNRFEVFVAGEDWTRRDLDAGSPRVQLYDPEGDTAVALDKLGIKFDLTDLRLVRDGVPLVIGQDVVWPRGGTAAEGLKKWVSRGNRVVILAQPRGRLDAAVLPAAFAFNRQSNNDPTYEKRTRPMSDGMHVNPARPWHPALQGIGRDQLEWWSDYTGWDQTKPGFPAVYPVKGGFRLTDVADLARTAIIANYDRGLEAIALAEVFDGKGSVLMTSFDLVPRVGKDPVADRMLRNLVRYAGSTAPRELHPLIEEPIRWGDYPTERGVVVEPIGGLVVNCRWQRPPTAPSAEPLEDNTGAWNTAPGDGFLPHGRRVYGPWTYTNATGIRDLSDPKNAAYLTGSAVEQLDEVDNAARKSKGASPIGTGEFWCRVPSGKKSAVTTVENPSDQPGRIEVQVNGGRAVSVEVPAGQTATVTAPIAGGATDLHVRFTADKSLVLLETSFE